MTEFRNLNTDNTLGGSSASDYQVSSQKAVKHYIDVRKDIPLGFGIWTEQAMNSEIWGTYTGSGTANACAAASYPEMWSLLNDIISGTIQYEEILAMTSTDLTSIPNLANAQPNNSRTQGINAYLTLVNQGIEPTLALSWFFIVDTTNSVFYVPQNVRDINAIGAYNIVVEKGNTTNDNGTYELTCCGNYKEITHLARLEKSTATHYGTSITTTETYKITQSASPHTEYPCDTFGFHTGNSDWGPFGCGHVNAKRINGALENTFKKQLANTKYKADVYIAKSGVDYSTRVSSEHLDKIYPNEAEPRCHETKLTNKYRICLRCWADEGFADPSQNTDVKCIGKKETEKYLLLYIEGQAASLPSLSNYNATNKRLYIKLAN